MRPACLLWRRYEVSGPLFSLDRSPARRSNLRMPRKTVKRKSSGAGKAPFAGSGLRAPVASRPVMPAHYGVSKSAKGMLDWTWARQRLTDSHNYVIVTVRSDGRPHAMGMHGVWFDDAFYFGTGDATRKAKNLAANPNCILINERLEELVVVEGIAERISYKELPKPLSALSKKKYGWPMEPMKGGLVFKLTPKTVFGLPEMLFATAPTRWKFE